MSDTTNSQVFGKPWRPGQSGNPGGRSKGVIARVRELTHDGADILQTLYEIMMDERAAARDRIEASRHLGDRLWGRPVQQVEGTHQHGILVIPWLPTDSSPNTIDSPSVRVLPGESED